MSRGPGRLQRLIADAFAANPDGIYSSDALIALAYPDADEITKAQRVAVLRAARVICQRGPWHFYRPEQQGGSLVYFNRVSVRSYTLARLRCDRSNNYRDTEHLIAIIDGNSGSKWDAHHVERTAKLMAPGGAWYRHVEEFKAELAGDTELVARLKAEQDAALAAIGERLKDSIAGMAGGRSKG